MSLLLLFNQNLQADEETARTADGLREKVLANSLDWTGIEDRGRANPQANEKTRSAISDLKVLIEKTDLTNSEKAKAVAIANALDALIESPEPEWRTILELFSSPALKGVIGIANLVVLLFQIFGLVT